MKNDFSVVSNKLRRIISDSRDRNNELCLQAISAYASLLYHYNQTYTDEFLEDQMAYFAELYKQTNVVYRKTRGVVLFYDGFGLDTRGLCFIYIKALVGLGYTVVYLTVSNAIYKQPTLHRIAGESIIWRYYDPFSDFDQQIKVIQSIIFEYQPEYLLLYTKPDDVAGIVAIQGVEDLVTRFMIDLTDHAYWLGVNACDYYIEFRDYGGIVANKERGISHDKLIKLPYYPVIDKTVPFEGFPFDVTNRKVMFSGGALYKTIDDQLTYYRIVDGILGRNADVVFLYAGIGDPRHIYALQEKYPERVYFIAERKDLYQVLKHADIYLNTYPLLGGLMTQYAIMAGCFPFTLAHGNREEGILLNEKELYYHDIDIMMADMDQGLRDREFLSDRVRTLRDGIISEKEFEEGLRTVLEDKKTSFPIRENDVDVNKIQDLYLNRFGKNDIRDALAKKRYARLIRFFPGLFFDRAVSLFRDHLQRGAKVCK